MATVELSSGAKRLAFQDIVKVTDSVKLLLMSWCWKFPLRIGSVNAACWWDASVLQQFWHRTATELGRAPENSQLCFCGVQAHRLNLFGARYQWIVAGGGTPRWTPSGCAASSLQSAADGSFRLQVGGVSRTDAPGVSGRVRNSYRSSEPDGTFWSLNAGLPPSTDSSGLPGLLPQTAEPGRVRGGPPTPVRLRRGVGRRQSSESGDGGVETAGEVPEERHAQRGGGGDAAGCCEEHALPRRHCELLNCTQPAPHTCRHSTKASNGSRCLLQFRKSKQIKRLQVFAGEPTL